MATGSLGSLNADLSAEIAQFLGAMDRAAYASEKTGEKIEKSFKAANDSLNRLVVRSVAAFASFKTFDALKSIFDDAVKTTAALDDMAEKTGASVEQLSALVTVSKVGGHDIGILEQAMTKLAKGISSTSEETKGASSALAFLGVKATDSNGKLRNTGDLMEDIAKALNGYADGTGKAAIAQDLFGKSGAQLLPFLKDLATSGALVSKVTTEQAAQAEQYEKTLKKLAIAKEDLGRTVALQLLPTLQTLADLWLANKTGSDGTLASVNKLASDNSITTWADKAAYAGAFVVDAFRGVLVVIEALGQGIAGTVAISVQAFRGMAQAALAGATGNLGGAATIGYETGKRIAEIQKDTAAQIQTILEKHKSVRFELEEQLKLRKLILAAQSGAFADQNDRRAGARPSLEYAPAKLSEARQEADKLQAVIDKIFNKDSGLDSGFFKDLQTLYAGLQQGRLGATQYVEAVSRLINQQPFVVKAAKEQNDAFDKAFEAEEKARLEIEKHIKSAREMVEGLEFEVEALQMTNREREIAIKLRALEKDGIEKGSAAYEMFAERIKAAVEAKSGLQDQINLWKGIESAAHDAFINIAQGGKSAFDRLKDSLKNGLYELLYQMTVKQWVISIAANVSGSGGVAVANALSGGGSGLGALGNLIGGAGLGTSILNGIGSGASALGLTGVSNFLGGATGALQGPTLTGAALGGNAAAAGASTSAFLTAAMPYLAIAGIAAGLYSAFSKPRGGPKEGGGYTGAYDAGGNLISGMAGMYGVSTANTDIQKLVTSGAAGIFGLIKNFGGSTGGLGIALGYDADPRGTAQSRLTAQLTAGGQSLYSVQGREFGRDLSAVGPALQLEMSRIAVVALQNSTLPAYLHKLFKSIDASTATQEQLDAIVKTASALKGFFDTLGSGDIVADAAKAFSASQDAIAAAADKNTASLQAVIDAYDGSAAAAEKLAGATSQYYLAQVQLQVQIEQVKKSIDEMFGNTFRQIELAGKDKQAQYDFFQSEAASLLDKILSSSSITEIQKLSENINADINAAFGLLSPEQQAAQSAAFLDQGRAAQALIDERIASVQKDFADSTRGQLDQVQALLTALGDTNQSAADTQVNAATIQLNAANTLSAAMGNGIKVLINGGGEVGR